MKRVLFMLAVVTLSATVTLYGKKKEAADITAAMARVTEKVTERDMMIYAEEARTAYGYVLPLSEPYYIRIKGNRIDSHLPYIGRADDVVSGSEGLMFEARVHNFKVVNLPKNGKEVTFEVKTLDDTYKFIIELSSDGMMEMTVSPGGKQKIFFEGYLSPDAKNYRGKI